MFPYPQKCLIILFLISTIDSNQLHIQYKKNAYGTFDLTCTKETSEPIEWHSDRGRYDKQSAMISSASNNAFIYTHKLNGIHKAIKTYPVKILETTWKKSLNSITNYEQIFNKHFNTELMAIMSIKHYDENATLNVIQNHKTILSIKFSQTTTDKESSCNWIIDKNNKWFHFYIYFHGEKLIFENQHGINCSVHMGAPTFYLLNEDKKHDKHFWRLTLLNEIVPLNDIQKLRNIPGCVTVNLWSEYANYEVSLTKEGELSKRNESYKEFTLKSFNMCQSDHDDDHILNVRSLDNESFHSTRVITVVAKNEVQIIKYFNATENSPITCRTLFTQEEQIFTPNITENKNNHVLISITSIFVLAITIFLIYILIKKIIDKLNEDVNNSQSNSHYEDEPHIPEHYIRISFGEYYQQVPHLYEEPRQM